MGQPMGNYFKEVSEPESRGERVSRFVEIYLRLSGRSLGELSFSIKADKRDMQRLLRERSCGHRLEDLLYIYFGDLFTAEVFPPRVAIREKELDRERAEIAARQARLEARRSPVAEHCRGLRVVPDQSGQADV